MNPEILAKIETRWPHLAPMCATVRATGNPQVRNAVINAVLQAEVAFLTPREIMHLAALRASGTNSRAKSKAARENGKKGGRPRKPGDAASAAPKRTARAKRPAMPTSNGPSSATPD